MGSTISSYARLPQAIMIQVSCYATGDSLIIFRVARMQEATEMLKEVDGKLEPSDSHIIHILCHGSEVYSRNLTSTFGCAKFRFFLNLGDDSKWLFHPSKWPETSN